jgi:hypothetical protein
MPNLQSRIAICHPQPPLPNAMTKGTAQQGVGKWFELRPIGNTAILGDAWGNCQHCVKMYEANCDHFVIDRSGILYISFFSVNQNTHTGINLSLKCIL